MIASLAGHTGKTIGLLLAGAVLLLLLLWLFQRRLIYLPLDHQVPSAGSVLAGASDVAVTTEDGLELGAWFVSPSDCEPRATVLFFPGNAGNRSARAPLARALAERGFSIMLVDYRGYGGNPGSPSERKLARDARAAWSYLNRREDVDADRLIYLGESLGAAVALELAIEHPPAALVLRSPFTSMTEIGKLHYPFLPVGWLLADRYPSIDRVSALRAPLLVIAGNRDNIVPLEHSRALFDAAPERSKRFVVIDGAGHNDWALLDGTEMLDAIDDFWCETKPETCAEDP
jgi:pimeloyl-ACP methyl ester carboxylesterase